MRTPKTKLTGIVKCPSGIRGLDEITNGGLPKGRPTLVCGSAGSGNSAYRLHAPYNHEHWRIWRAGNHRLPVATDFSWCGGASEFEILMSADILGRNSWPV